MINIILNHISDKQAQDEINAIKYITPQNVPMSLNYLKNYPKEKSWYDLNFDLFDSKLARLQTSCTCRSGAQLPGACAHISTCLWLIYHVLYGNLDEALKQTKRDQKIVKNIIDITGYKKYKKNNQNHCICNEKKNEKLFFCDGCKKKYHPSCIDTSENDIKENKKTFTMWHCKHCQSQWVWVVRNA